MFVGNVGNVESGCCYRQKKFFDLRTWIPPLNDTGMNWGTPAELGCSNTEQQRSPGPINYKASLATFARKVSIPRYRLRLKKVSDLLSSNQSGKIPFIDFTLHHPKRYFSIPKNDPQRFQVGWSIVIHPELMHCRHCFPHPARPETPTGLVCRLRSRCSVVAVQNCVSVRRLANVILCCSAVSEWSGYVIVITVRISYHHWAHHSKHHECHRHHHQHQHHVIVSISVGKVLMENFPNNHLEFIPNPVILWDELLQNAGFLIHQQYVYIHYMPCISSKLRTGRGAKKQGASYDLQADTLALQSHLNLQNQLEQWKNTLVV